MTSCEARTDFECQSLKRKYLAPMEIFIIGGSVDVGGSIEGLSGLYDRSKADMVDEEVLLRPIALDSNSDLEEVSQARERIGVLKGILPILDEKQFDLSLQNISPALKPARLNETGYISPEWEIELMGSQDAFINGKEFVNEVSLTQDAMNAFDLRYNANTGKFQLSYRSFESKLC